MAISLGLIGTEDGLMDLNYRICWILHFCSDANLADAFIHSDLHCISRYTLTF